MRTVIKALLAATMMVPAVTRAQDAPPPPRGDGHRGGEDRGWQRHGPGPRPEGPPAAGGCQGARPDFRSERPQPWRGGPGAGRGQAPWQAPEPSPEQGGRRFDRRPDLRPDRPFDDRREPDRVAPERLTPERPVLNRLEVDNRGDHPPPLAQGRPDWRGGSWNPQPGWNRGGYDHLRDVDRRDWDDRRGWGGREADRGAWNRGWRDDRRYDWDRYRAGNRGAYRLPHYYAPSGWGYGYRRFAIGTTLWPGLWGSHYWIDDPFAYRLPEAYGSYRWVRYYDDALLVDIRTGRVVDVVYAIFW